MFSYVEITQVNWVSEHKICFLITIHQHLFDKSCFYLTEKGDCLPKTSREERGRTREEKAYLNIGGEYCSLEDFKKDVDFYELQQHLIALYEFMM